MKYYSELLNKTFNSVEELEKAESETKRLEQERKIKEKQLREERGNRAKEVEEAYKIANEAQKKANKLLADFIKDYGSFHTSITEVDLPGYFDMVWNLFI